MKKICLVSAAGLAVLMLSMGWGGSAHAQRTVTLSSHSVRIYDSDGVNAPQVKDDLFAGTEKFAQGASDVTEVNLDKSMLGMVRGNSELAHKMEETHGKQPS